MGNFAWVAQEKTGGRSLKRVMKVGAILALVVVAAVPAIAQLAGGVGQSSESGDNALSFVQYDGEIDDFEPGGIGVGFGGSNSVGCPSTVQQSSAASSS